MNTNNNELENQTIKTSLLFGLANIISLSFFLADPKSGLVASIAVNACLLKYFHGLGERRRTGANIINEVNTFFSPRTKSQELTHGIKNVLNGGEATFDELAELCEKLSSHPR